MSTFRWAAVVLLLGCLAEWDGGPVAVLSSQGGQQAPTFKSATTLVEVDVIVRDRQDHFVGDLGASDFEVIEDGVRREVSAIYRVLGPGEVRLPTPVTSPVPALPAEQVQRVLVFLFDQAHLQPAGFRRGREAALAFLPQNFREGDLGGVVAGATMVNNRVTSSREEIEKALRDLQPAADQATASRETRSWPRLLDAAEAWHISRDDPGYLAEAVSRACRERAGECSAPGGREFVESQVQSKASAVANQARVQCLQTLSTLSALAGGLARLPGRKTVILLTEGFFVEDNWSELRRVVQEAARASVRIYSIDTRGLNRGSAGSEILDAAQPQRPGLSRPPLDDVQGDGPNSLAVDTGGFVVRNENDLGQAFADIDRDTSSYYVLGFRTTRPPDGRYHPIQVRVNRKGVTTRARKGYVASPDAPALAEATSQPVPSVLPDQPVAGEPSSDPPAKGQPVPGAVPAGAGPPPPVTPRPEADARPAAASEAAVRLKPHVEGGVGTLRGAGGGTTSPAVPEDVQKAATAGWEAYQRGDVEKARMALQSIADHPATPPWAWYVLGWSEFASGAYPAAATAWERVRTSVAEFATVYFDLADAYRHQQEFGKAIAVLREAQKRWPADVEVYNAIGVLQAARGALDEAIKTFEHAVQVGPSDATACYNLARCLELRYVRALRTRNTGPGFRPEQAWKRHEDRVRAVDYYERTVKLGGPNAAAAREALTRLGTR